MNQLHIIILYFIQYLRTEDELYKEILETTKDRDRS